ncbi:hypothetical protein LEMLEM_LOCUS16451 [Lemmus lemmus]
MKNCPLRSIAELGVGDLDTFNCNRRMQELRQADPGSSDLWHLPEPRSAITVPRNPGTKPNTTPVPGVKAGEASGPGGAGEGSGGRLREAKRRQRRAARGVPVIGTARVGGGGEGRAEEEEEKEEEKGGERGGGAEERSLQPLQPR